MLRCLRSSNIALTIFSIAVVGIIVYYFKDQTLSQTVNATFIPQNAYPEKYAVFTEHLTIFPPNYTNNNNKLGYIWYAANEDYACGVIICYLKLLNFTTQQNPELAKSLDYIVMVDSEKISKSAVTRFLNYGLIVIEATAPKLAGKSIDLYDGCLLKLSIFTMDKYDRLIYMDADGVPMKSLDHLFYLPAVRLAAPWAYYENEPCFSSILMVLQPSTHFYTERILPYITDTPLRAAMIKRYNRAIYDMDILNLVFEFMEHEHARTTVEVLMLPYYYGVTTTLWAKQRLPPSIIDPIVRSGSADDWKYLQSIITYLHFSVGDKPWRPSQKDILHSPFLQFVYNEWKVLADQVCVNITSPVHILDVIAPHSNHHHDGNNNNNNVHTANDDNVESLLYDGE